MSNSTRPHRSSFLLGAPREKATPFVDAPLPCVTAVAYWGGEWDASTERHIVRLVGSIFIGVRGRGILGKSHTRCCIAPIL